MRRGSAKGGSPAKKQPRRKKAAAKRSSAAKTARKSEPTGLAGELRQARARQAATSEILRVISQSPSNVQPVFDAIVQAAVRLLGCDTAHFLRCDGATWSPASLTGPKGLVKGLPTAPVPIDPDANFPSRAIVTRKVLHLPDWSAIDLPPFEERTRKMHGISSSLLLPLLRGDQCIGVLAIASKRANHFAKGDIALAESFRDQALIAIENARLFNETKEALERQTATADILKVIASSPSDVQPVFDAIAETAKRLLGSYTAMVTRVIDGVVHLAASTADDEAAKTLLPYPLSSDRIHAKVARTGELVSNADVDAATHLPQEVKDFARTIGWRSMLAVPMLRNAVAIGTVGITRREPGEFDAKTIELLKTFADQAVIAIENVRLFNETQEALAHQTATSDVLQVIGGSMADTQPVFERILDSVERLFDIRQCSVILARDGMLHLVARRGIDIEGTERLFPAPMAQTRGDEVIRTGQQAYVPSAAASAGGSSLMRRVAEMMGDYSVVMTPLVWEGQGIGIISAARAPNAVFSEKELALLRTFADQAVIAIQNARQFNDTREALERQTATADVLKVIASSPSNLQPVFDAIAERSNELMHGNSTTVFRFVGEQVELAAMTSVSEQADAMLRARFPMPIAANAVFETVHRGEISEMRDTESPDNAHKMDPAVARARGFRSRLIVPLKSDSGVIGAISVTRKEPGAFADKDIELLQTFADQAVIAISNVGLFNEVQARTRDLSESLQQQTATADVLKVISRSAFDLKQVLDTLVSSAARLCAADRGVIFQREGEVYGLAASYGFSPEYIAYAKENPIKADLSTSTGRVALGGKTIHIPDVLADPDYSASERQRLGGYRTTLGVPLVREGTPIGAFSLTRSVPEPFTPRQIELVETFADQTVIAIENARLFNETQEALERQTATADILKVIASSPDDVQPVFEAIAERSNRIVDGRATAVYSLVDGIVHLKAFTPTSPEADAALQAFFPRPLSHMPWGESIRQAKMDQISDLQDGPYPEDGRNLARLRGFRGVLLVPLLRDQKPIGAIGVTRATPGKFSDHHVQLLQTFADQAVIAIENVRLFNETQEALERQTATADILKVIASSPDDVQPVFEAIAERSNRIVEGRSTAVYSLVDNTLHLMAFTSTSPEADAALRAMFPRSLSRFRWGEAISRGEVYQVPDMQDPSPFSNPEGQELARRRGFRAMMAVPLVSEMRIIGVISVTRVAPGKFAEHHVQLLQTFADQAVIAISNVELFRQVQQRTRDLSQSLDDLRAAQDRLVQTEKLASLGQLTAGIAHEIKNPLNFVNNFSALSAELTVELNDLLKDAALTDKMREDVGELTRLLQDNLEKVVQHGKRADSIVKNMLLHSREGSGEQRSAEINALVDESLNLAYHGARAEKSGFNITLQRDFDANAGSIELFPQEITRALLNLISNGFYAATKRQKENGEQEFEPLLVASTKNLGSTVEIRIRDNGTGIPPEVKEKMFNPFFTTKPAGEGTGLGLSMTHDIIVKQHGGRIDVATAPGQFTEFTIVLPRTNGSARTRA